MRVALDARKAGDFGIGTYIRGLVGALAAGQPDWTFVLVGEPHAFATPAAANVEWLADRSPKYGLAELFSMSRRARQTRADLFHAPHYVLPFGLPCPAVVTIHDCIHLRYPAQLPRPLGVLPRRLSLLYARAMLRHAGRAARRVIAVSESTARDLETLAGLDPQSIDVVPNGCDPAFRRDARPEELAAADAILEPAGTGRYVLFAGNPKPHKNLAGLLRAVARLREQVDPWLVLAGVDAPAARRLLREAAPGLPEGRLLATGTVDRPTLRGLFARARIVAAPSLFEGFGLTALEAMSAGIPVVAARAGGLPEVVGDAGLLVDPRDPAEIADSIHRLWEDGPLRARLAQQGRERAARFTWEEAARRTARVYRKAVGVAAP